MNSYERNARTELMDWKSEMRERPHLLQKATKGIQIRINNLLPEKYHDIVTSAVKNLTKTVLAVSQNITNPPLKGLSLQERETMVRDRMSQYKTAAVIEGAATGAGGILLGLSDFPLLLGIKLKFLYEAARIYGFDVNDYRERLYILHIFQLAFSSKGHVNRVFDRMENWGTYSSCLPKDLNQFDWESFQKEYRDYIDLAKLLQLMPGIGAIVGSYVNNKLMNKLGETAIQSYRMRLFS